MILAAGGGNTELNVGTEGTDIAKWLNGLGVSAFILRYRLRPYDSATDALADTAQSIKTVRAHAREWDVEPARIGIMGFTRAGANSI
jgi:acetyl esterase/lipase